MLVLFANYGRKIKTFRQRTHYSTHGIFKTVSYSKLMRRILVFVKDIFRGNPLINILCVVMLLAGCEIDVILVR